jgi:hypothetical protein
MAGPLGHAGPNHGFFSVRFQNGFSIGFLDGKGLFAVLNPVFQPVKASSASRRPYDAPNAPPGSVHIAASAARPLRNGSMWGSGTDEGLLLRPLTIPGSPC